MRSLYPHPKMSINFEQFFLIPMSGVSRLTVEATGLACLLSLSLITAPVQAASSPIVAVSLPLTNPLEQLLNNVLQQFQTITTAVNQQVSQVLGPLQEDVVSAIATTFGPTSFDVQQAETNILNAVLQGGPSEDGINPVVAHRGTAEGVLTRMVIEANHSDHAQSSNKKMLEDTQTTLLQVKDCAQTGLSAQATQDVLKSLLCQQQGMAAMNASLIPLLQKNADANTTVAANLKLLNEQMTGQMMAALRSQQAEAAMKRSIYTQLSFIEAPAGTAVLKTSTSR